MQFEIFRGCNNPRKSGIKLNDMNTDNKGLRTLVSTGETVTLQFSGVRDYGRGEELEVTYNDGSVGWEKWSNIAL